MLKSLNINNVAVIEQAQIELGQGFNVLTGETGAGKSIIIDSINAILGERTSREIVRTGAPYARITAVFEGISSAALAALSDLGISCEDDTLMIQRDINSEGRGNSRINGSLVTASMLKQVGRMLINIHGQHDNQALLSPEKHFEFLDKLGDNRALLNEYGGKFHRLSEKRRIYNKIVSDDKQNRQMIDYLTYRINELEQADIWVGEKEQLTERRTIIQNSETIAMAANNAYAAINGDDEAQGAASLLQQAMQLVSSASRHYSSLNDISNGLSDMVYQLEEYAAELRDIAEETEFDPFELERIDERLDLLYRLGKKYGETEEEMLECLDTSRAQLEEISFSDEKMASLEREITLLEKETKRLADSITETRTQTGHKFCTAVKQQLEFLDMPNVRMEVSLQRVELNENGQDRIEFLIATNAGDIPKPLVKIASGGELSRIMLAIKNVLADKDDIDTLIFDEIDTGISGRAAQKVGIKLRQTARGRQIICVTHSSQIASRADNHYLIEKSVRDGKTYTSVKQLDFDGRVNEIARIIGGDRITEAALQNAREMVQTGSSD